MEAIVSSFTCMNLQSSCQEWLIDTMCLTLHVGLCSTVFMCLHSSWSAHLFQTINKFVLDLKFHGNQQCPCSRMCPWRSSSLSHNSVQPCLPPPLVNLCKTAKHKPWHTLSSAICSLQNPMNILCSLPWLLCGEFCEHLNAVLQMLYALFFQMTFNFKNHFIKCILHWFAHTTCLILTFL